jgi:dynein light intermediate chain 1, cytosolic
MLLTASQAEKIEFLEKSQGWKEADFDQVLQYLRTVLLRRKIAVVSCSEPG